MNVLFLAGLVISVYIAAKISSEVLYHIFGPNPLGRLLKIVGFIAGGVGYVALCEKAITFDSSAEMLLLVFFGPIGLLLLIKLISYIFTGN